VNVAWLSVEAGTLGGGWTADRLAATGSCLRGGQRSGSPDQWRVGSAGAPSPTVVVLSTAPPR